MKTPRQTIRTLIRKAFKARYDRDAKISKDGAVTVPGFAKMHIADWRTLRTESGSIWLIHRDDCFFKIRA